MLLKIAIGSDHHGIAVRIKIAEMLLREGHNVSECGPVLDSREPTDYPDIAAEVSDLVSSNTVDRGILICGTGIGMCITANKFASVRAAPIIDELQAELSRRHNDLNILCLSSEMLSEDMIFRIIDIWLKTPFDGGRHEKRIEKIEKIERDLGIITD
ncbi:MAG: ribose 5-phosphate isomerase B [Planctomycetaceae bacterium]|jgi:ribose 5-phosphate isomerase B|nr:ribose 5-phosphate isomerase B [Planctomycetaceae bacterium]